MTTHFAVVQLRYESPDYLLRAHDGDGDRSSI